MEDKKLNEKESLELITQMIQSTKDNVEKGEGTTFLIWGYVSTIVALSIYFAWTITGNIAVCWAWWLIPILGYTITFISKRNSPKRIITGIDRIIGKVWLVAALCCITAPVIAWFTIMPILFVEAFIVTIATTITGLIIKFKIIYIPGFIGIGLSYSLLFVQTDTRILIFAALFVVLMVVPGPILNAICARKAKNN